VDTPTWTSESVPPPESGPRAETAPSVPSSPSPDRSPLAPVLRAGVSTSKRGGSAGNVLLVVALVVAVGGIAFAGGRLTAPASTSRTGFGNAAQAGGYPGAGQGGAGAGLGAGGGALAGGALTLRGTVSQIGPNSITLTLESGSSIQMPTTSSTTYHAQAAATAGEVVVGSRVAVEVTGFRGGRSPNASGAPNTPGAGEAGGAAAGGAVASARPASTPRPGQAELSLGPALDVTITP
jgi:hypothetical protein